MLTIPTVEILNKLASESDTLYSQGGLLYKYSFGHRCAHSDLSNIEGVATNNEVETLEFFIASAVSDPYPVVTSHEVKQVCSKLLSSLANDFNGFQGPRVFIEEDDISKTVTLVYTASNDYHVLKLFWSID
ncbi:hypothetical protein MIB92_19880 [Aestuariirhabdus sp. Z084]|uniref:hypothetical protein n=1 Tax=Aestuariirhabdus haliotis TaxID=2918751 RepID=UPI00201B40CF|nr:hypothetical protein [Aestuariirhabdus haliotis]MCL6417918.1 hypothetical protein [Aestuariirhabdus haliotis]MCL6421763.1 hypothetical protein [Aestuariirhabdus haliotis]